MVCPPLRKIFQQKSGGPLDQFLDPPLTPRLIDPQLSGNERENTNYQEF